MKELIKKFGFESAKISKILMSIAAKLDKYEHSKDVDVKLYRSVVVSSRPPRDHAICIFNTKQASDTWPLLAPLTGSAHSIETPSGLYS